MGRPRTQLGKVESRICVLDYWITQSRLAKHLDCKPQSIHDYIKRYGGGIWEGSKKLPRKVLYHIEQVKLIDSFIAGNIELDVANELWKQKKKLIGKGL